MPEADADHRPPPASPLQLLHPSWAAALAPVASELDAIVERVELERAGGVRVLPAPAHVLRAFSRPLESARVLIVGQDPYPRADHAVGLSFSIPPGVRPWPGTLRNIMRELVDDTHVTPPTSGDLTPWVEQGVLLLNRVLTVREGASASHRSLGWQKITDAAVTALAERARQGSPLVSVLWGRQAAEVAGLLAGTPVVAGVHPSPLSASRGFFGSRPFSAVNAALARAGSEIVSWELP